MLKNTSDSIEIMLGNGIKRVGFELEFAGTRETHAKRIGKRSGQCEIISQICEGPPVGNILSAFDRSIRTEENFPYSLELITDPIYLPNANEVLWYLTLNSMSIGNINNSCGLHIHYDGRTIDILSLKKIMMAAVIFEGVLFASSKYDRLDTRYCMPLLFFFFYKDILNFKNKSELMDIIYLNHKNKTSNKYGYDFPYATDEYQPMFRTNRINGYTAFRYNARYCSFNIHSWFYRKTFEFRHFENGSIYENIQKYKLVNDLIKFALTTSGTKIQEIYMDYISNPNKFSLNYLLELLNSKAEIKYNENVFCKHAAIISEITALQLGLLNCLDDLKDKISEISGNKYFINWSSNNGKIIHNTSLKAMPYNWLLNMARSASVSGVNYSDKCFFSIPLGEIKKFIGKLNAEQLGNYFYSHGIKTQNY